jgi:hypothetical protein
VLEAGRAGTAPVDPESRQPLCRIHVSLFPVDEADQVITESIVTPTIIMRLLLVTGTDSSDRSCVFTSAGNRSPLLGRESPFELRERSRIVLHYLAELSLNDVIDAECPTDILQDEVRRPGKSAFR